MANDEPQEVQNWVKQRVLGSGGFGVVTLWKHKNKEEMIALKKCRSGTDHLLTPKHKERWSKEVDIMQRLSHPNVVRAIPVPPELAILRSELPLLCMEFCSKGDLRQILNRSENCCGLQERDVRFLISDVKNAVQYLHSMKITHRDLKPENIVLQQNENRIVYKLIDLGYAKELDQSSICTSFVGTLQYLAPELFMSQTYSCSVDYWSLGLVSHEVITGVRPFLPHMAPVAWMNHVKSKSSNDICAFEDQDGSILFCKELFPENHITVSLKYHMEEWLKTLLEWDPKKRGRNKDMKVVVFDLADDILKKKIVQLFCVTSYKKLSYEIDDSTAVTTLKEWIRRDTGVPVEEQELLLANGKNVDETKEACQCWNMKNIKDGTPMAYVYRRRYLTIPQVTPRIPFRVSKMMEEPRNPMDYIHQKRAWAHAVFFLQQEHELYRTFRQSHTVKLLHLFLKCELLKQKCQNLNSQLQQARAEQYFSVQSLQVDEEYFKKLKRRGLQKILQKWLQNRDNLARSMTDLSKKASEIQLKCDFICKKMASIQTDPHLRLNEPNILRNLLEAGIKCYEHLRRRPRETRSQKSDSIDMVKVIYNCLKQRDILLRDKEFNFHLQQMIELQNEMEELLLPIDHCIDGMKDIRTHIRSHQIERQEDVWSLVIEKEERATPGKINQDIDTQYADNKLGYSENNTPQKSINDFQNKLSIISPNDIQPCYSITTSDVDSSSVIQENTELRHKTLDAMNTSYKKVLSIVSESLNWGHLEQ